MAAVETGGAGPVRATRQRAVVRDMVAEFDTFLSAQEIHRLLVSRGKAVGLSTVYRSLQTLADADLVDTIRNEEGETLYRQCSPRHHHHLVCRSCGQVLEVEGPAVETWADKAAAKHGFTNVAHTVEIFGLCPACS